MAVELLTEDEVEGVGEQTGMGIVHIALEEDHVEVGVLIGQEGEGARRHFQQNGLEGGDPHLPGHGVGQVREVRFGAGDGADDLVGVRGEHAARIGETHASAHRGEKRHPGLPFECGQLLRDGRRGVVQSTRRLGESASALQFHQHAQPFDAQHDAPSQNSSRILTDSFQFPSLD